MSADAKKVLEEALKLPPEARAAVASSLIESLDTEVDSDAEAQWAVEIEKRIREIDSGLVNLVPWAEARKRILAGRNAQR
jgi:putative addiction module component (TIGR02574 family)